MTPAEVPAELVEKAAEEIVGSWDGNYVFMPTAREMARDALAAVLPEIQAQALRDYADFIVWSGGSEKGLNISPRMLRTRADRVVDSTEGTTT